ncbi:MAG: hypothetical protein ABSE00_03300 [Chitinispirillaceae bacterium]|jgi:hypothetical protein
MQTGKCREIAHGVRSAMIVAAAGSGQTVKEFRKNYLSVKDEGMVKKAALEYF